MFTVTTIKADVGRIGGHTRPSQQMLERCKQMLEEKRKSLLTDFRITYTGDDICLLMIHKEGEGSKVIHDLSWKVFKEATAIAQDGGLYGAGQDLLKDAPSGNVRGAGPGVAEISFEYGAKERPAEAFLVFTADKCGPGVFNFPLWAVFTSPFFCSGLLLPKMKVGFRFKLIDMEHVGADRTIQLDTPEQHLDVATLVRDENYGIQ
ncbi:fructose-1,6-bisphosphatase, partial [Patescibacteria group bacterium]|nr:fructose-1,6-bisphosphatase [Patescibacteria group bacterium]